MIGQLRNLLPLMTGAFFLLVGSTLLSYILQLALEQNGGSDLAGFGFAAYYLGFSVGVLRVRPIIESVGHIRTFAAFATLLSSITLIHPLTEQSELLAQPLWGEAIWVWIWLLMRAVAGLSMAALLIVFDSWVGDGTDPEHRGSVLGIFYTLFAMGQAAGSLMINLERELSVELYVFASIAISLSLMPIVLSRRPAPQLLEYQPLSFRALFRASPTGVVAGAVGGVIVSNLHALIPSLGEQLGLSTFDNSLLVVAYIIGGAAAQYPLGRLSDRLDRRLVLIAVGAAGGLISLATIVLMGVEGSLPLLIALVCGMGMVAFVQYPLGIAQLFDRLERSQYTAAATGIILLYAIGAVLGTALTGWLMERFGSAVLPLVNGVTLVGLAVFTGIRVMQRDTVPQAEQEPFIASPATLLTEVLDPRYESLESDQSHQDDGNRH